MLHCTADGTASVWCAEVHRQDGRRTGILTVMSRVPNPRVAVFDAIDDQLQLTTATLRVLGCQVHRLTKGDNGLEDVADQLQRAGPFDVVLWDIPQALRAPCDELEGMSHRGAFGNSGVIVTTADRDRLQPVLDTSGARTILGRPYTFTALMQAVDAAASKGRLLPIGREAAPALVACRLNPMPAL